MSAVVASWPKLRLRVLGTGYWVLGTAYWVLRAGLCCWVLRPRWFTQYPVRSTQYLL